MKTLLILLFIIPFYSFSQGFSEVVEIPGKSFDKLYSSAREWFAKEFISESNPLLMDDRVSGKIIAKGSIQISESNVVWYPNFTVKVSFKDGRYKSEIIDITITTNVSEYSSETKFSFQDYFDKKENYKNLADPVWVMNHGPSGVKITKATAKAEAKPNQIIYNLICKTESEMKDILSKIQFEMKKDEVDW